MLLWRIWFGPQALLTAQRTPTVYAVTADVSGLVQHCTVEPSPLPGYDYLVRFRGAAGNIIVTLRVSEVEQVFCPDQGGTGIAFANLTLASPAFVDVTQQQVEALNALVGAMIR